MFTQILVYVFFFAAGVLALFAVFRLVTARDSADFARFHTFLTDCALVLVLVGFGQILRLLTALFQV
ncbi:MAG TPA: hypothetical protein VIL30_19255 [Ramlibacter sp.]|jgi:hypothetical protein